MNLELKKLLNDQQRLVNMLQQRSDLLEDENQQLKHIVLESQRRYEKAVREMQFFKKKYDRITDIASVPPSSPMLTVDSRPRTNSNAAASVFSLNSSASTEATSIYSHHHHNRHEEKRHTKQQHHSNMMQRKTEPLAFGGSDALWDTITKNNGSDVTVEKIISNFLRRGGSPNTAKQSPSEGVVKYGYGMIHAAIVSRASSCLDLLLQQGANPNAITLGQTDEDKISPCYLAASIGWLPGLQKLVQAGGDLLTSRGGGSKKRTALHMAAANGHPAVAEFIVNMTQGQLNLETDSQGATILHYACASGHVELVSFIVEVCQVPLLQVDQRSELPLHWATRHGRLEVVALLLERYGCEVNAYTTKKVATCYDLAKAAGHKRLAEYLKSQGGLSTKKMDKKHQDDKVPFHLETALAKNGLF
ncbi:ankyrin, partial [Backusella circina FSU 941]